MIGRLLGSTEWKQLASFASPAFFDVMPAKALISRARKLRAASKDTEAFRHAVALRQAALQKADLPIEVSPERTSPSDGSTEMPADKRAHAVVTLYFQQLFGNAPILLDLRSESFRPGRDRLLWRPASWVAELSPQFLDALRRVYRGFYSGNDDEFRSGLKLLDLLDSEDVFREQFGSDVHAVTFRTHHFVSTFHEVFVRCKRAKKALHPDFLPLGVYLAALYEHLESLGVTVDVARCFERATRAEASQ